ncbi:flagellar basal body P-ring formation protein FlgA [Deefgea piscis]|uniref:Flagella basal body P-ring formation protein FlgA n=1 Tax=Deefgea piscis TaxID=2739061 RepID=A0A6M8SU55_9NEIS|nr:flagellar basal body P-ring formation chaperone FlgA [Deefgea piscis]QKJ67644.1 flagellar basal body P-ring formation protein FlgA [Deefgea piscis]
MRKILISSFALFSSLLTPLFAAPTSQDLKVITQEVNQWLSAELANSPGTASFEVRPMDARLKLTACARREISLPAGYRLVGNTMLRVKCVDGANWSFNLPTKISIAVNYAVAARPLAANQILDVGDIAMQQGDLAVLPGSVFLDPTPILGRTLNSPVSAGQALRQEQLRASMAILQNQKVKIIYRQDGIEITNEGIAMNAAAEGQPVRVRIDKNKIISGTAQQGAIVMMGQ